tara:strand:+ start:4268 stop:6607 length:2340 start_codon:yes stop_codon:yes gene_type:complete
MQNQLDDIIDFRQFFYKIIRNWFLFFISILVAFVIAFAYNRYTNELFYVKTSILIKEDNNITSASDLLYEKVQSNTRSLENQELLIKSFPNVFRTLEDLRFDITYYIEGKIKVTETYISPIIVKCDNTKKIKSKSFKVQIIDENRFSLTDLSSKKQYERNFNDIFLFNDVEMSIEYNTDFKFVKEVGIPVTIVKFNDLRALTQSYQNKIVVSQEDRESTVINISMLIEDQLKGVIFLNKLTENYIKSEVDEKNIASRNTVKFINNQLVEMSDSLALIEQKIEEYKNTNKITDLSLKAQSIYTNIVTLETELAKSKTINTYYNYLSDYLNKGDNLEGISVPASFGVNDLALNSLISQLVEIQIKKNILLSGGQVNNPAISQYNRQSDQLVLNLKEAINTSKSANNLLLADYRSRINKMEKSLSNIPHIERELLNIERLQSISENIYIFLLKKRAEAKITSSSNVSDSRVLEPAMFTYKKPVSPDKKKSYILALIFGVLLPVLYLLVSEMLNDTIVLRSDLERFCSIPVLAIIGRNYSGHNLLSEQSPKSSVYEGFRALRSNLNFTNISKKNMVYLVTSSISGEGKTYIAENLAIVYAKSGKKTLLIGADLRRPKIYADFGFDNTVGISNHLLSDNSISEVILESKIDGLDILTSGPLPQNPADALLTDKFIKMMDYLKKQYDIIILDTPPLGLVADSLTLMKYSDVNLYIVRQNYTKKGLLNYVNEMYNRNRLGDLHLVFNDIKEGSGAYGYGYGDGYGYGYGHAYGYSYSQEGEYFDNE